MDTADRTDVDAEALLDELARDLLPHDGSASPQPTAPAASCELPEARRRLVPASALLTVVDMSIDSENEVPHLCGNRFAALGETTFGVNFPARR